jgi:hypothetical protein
MRKILPSLLSFVMLLTGYSGAAQSFTSSNLPIVVINTSGQYIDTAYQKFFVNMGIIYNGPGIRNYMTDPFNNYNGQIEIELHGSSSLWLPKKSYNVETVNAAHVKTDVSLLGMPLEHDWILNAPYQDKTLIRDELTFNIFSKMGHYCSRSRFVELVVNGNYRGVYELQEKIKRDDSRVNVAKLKLDELSGDELTGGYIIKLDKILPGDQGWYSNYPSDITGDSANFFLYFYPKPDSIPVAQKNYIHGFFDQFENALVSPYFTSPDSGYAHYIDVGSFIDNMLLNEMSKNVDGYRASTYFYKDRDSKDMRLHAGPLWDYDLSWYNCSYNGGNVVSGWQYQQYAYNNFVPFWWWQFMLDPAFKNQLKCRYTTLRATILSNAALFAHVDSMAIYLNESQARNFTRWPIMGTIVAPNPSPVPADYAGEIAQLKNWIQSRLSWLDANMPGTCIISTEETLAAESSLHAFPNPFTNTLQVEYYLNDNSNVKLEIYNILGERILLPFEGMKKAGAHIAELSTEKLANGVYIVRLTGSDKADYLKVVKN